MIEVLKKNYWGKSQAFLLPLTGLSKTLLYPVDSYLFWDEYSIENYQLILRWKWNDYNEFLTYCRKHIFPILDKKGCLTEVFDGEKETVFIVDISEWALDVEMFLKGKYSKMSGDAKDIIEEYHHYYDKGKKVPPEISAAIDPHFKFKAYGGMSAIEYVAENYGLDLEELTKIGELADQYDKKAETLGDFYIMSDRTTASGSDCNMVHNLHIYRYKPTLYEK